MPALSAHPTASPATEGHDPAPAPARDVVRLCVLGLVAAGLSLRLLQYLADRSLWLDESLIVSSIINRSFAGLLQPLDYGQTAPVGFLFLVKLATVLFGTSEYALRLVPLLAGLVALVAFVPVAGRYLTRTAVVPALAVFALAPYLLYYTSEVKQYSLDVLLSVAVLGVAFDAAEARRLDLRRALLLAAVGVFGVWLSQPAVFMLAGAGLVLGVRALRAGDRARVGVLALVGAAWAVSFALSYAASRRGLADPAYMQAFWQSGFMPLLPTTADEWLWLPKSFAHVFREPLGAMGNDSSGMELPQTIGGLVAFAAGAGWMAYRRDWRLAMLLSPLLLALAASALRLYPFGATYLTSGRVLLFLLPPFVIVMAAGVEQLRVGLGRKAGPLAAVYLMALLLIPSLVHAAVMVPQVRDEMKPILEYATANRQPSDPMYVYYNGRSSFEYYAPRYGWDQGNVVMGTCSRLKPRGYLADVERLRGRRRAWFLIADGFATQGYNERQLIVRYLDHIGKRLDDRVANGVFLYLYDLGEEHRTAGPFPVAIPEFPPTMVSMDCRGPWAPEPYAATRG